MTNKSSDSSSSYDSLWGDLKLDKLPKEIDIKRLKQVRPVLTDEPLLPSILTADVSPSSADLDKSSSSNKKSKSSKKKTTTAPTTTATTAANATIDSYIVNTIKLNQILKKRTSFDQVEFFKRSLKQNSRAKNDQNVAPAVTINSDEQARFYLKQFVTVMCLHIDFTGKSVAIGLAFEKYILSTVFITNKRSHQWPWTFW
jgi:hypothetical protein